MATDDHVSRWGAKSLSAAEKGFGTLPDGRKDMQGALLPARLEGEQWQSANFGALRRGHFATIVGCRFENCIISKADLSDLIEKENHFLNCVFDRVDFSRSSLGVGTSHYEGCRFDRCKFMRPTFVNAVFEDCDFNGTFSGVDFSASGFWSCRFSGRLKDVWFKGDYASATERQLHRPIDTGLHKVDFSEARLQHITVSHGCVLDELVLPAEACVVDVTRLDEKFVDEIAAGLEDDEQALFRRKMEIIRGHHAEQREKIVSKFDFDSHCPRGSEWIMERIHTRSHTLDA